MEIFLVAKREKIGRNIVDKTCMRIFDDSQLLLQYLEGKPLSGFMIYALSSSSPVKVDIQTLLNHSIRFNNTDRENCFLLAQGNRANRKSINKSSMRISEEFDEDLAKRMIDDFIDPDVDHLYELRFGENAIKISTIGIIELYEKCGMLEKAKNTFNERNIEYHIRKRENQKELEKIKAKWEERNEKS